VKRREGSRRESEEEKGSLQYRFPMEEKASKHNGRGVGHEFEVA